MSERKATETVQLGRIGSGAHSRTVAGLAALALAASLIVGVHPVARATPPPNPTNTQLQNARQDRNAVAGQVATLAARVANLQSQLNQLQAGLELAKQKYDLAHQKLDQATAKAAKTKQAASAAQHRVVSAQQEFVAYAQAAYMSGSVQGMTGTLLTAHDPSTLLQQSALQGYQASHQIGAINNLERATVTRSNADAAARLAVQNQKHATAAAEQAKQAAVDAYQAAQAQQARLKQQVGAAESQLEQARSSVATLNGEKAAWVKWHRHQLAIIAARKLAARLAREKQARLARERLAREQQQQNSGGGQSGSGGGGGSSAPSGGSWTLAKGQQAAARAAYWIGTMYAWDGGNAYGPTRGVCAGDGAFNDCNVIGFDCSGLAMYAWGPNLYLDHYAATQYNQAGSFHPTPGNFEPGDLLFWSSNGTVAGIHHVAIYVGGGMVVQAPESGAVITKTPWQSVSWGYYDATRPLTHP